MNHKALLYFEDGSKLWNGIWIRTPKRDWSCISFYANNRLNEKWLSDIFFEYRIIKHES